MLSYSKDSSMFSLKSCLDKYLIFKYLRPNELNYSIFFFRAELIPHRSQFSGHYCTTFELYYQDLEDQCLILRHKIKHNHTYMRVIWLIWKTYTWMLLPYICYFFLNILTNMDVALQFCRRKWTPLFFNCVFILSILCYLALFVREWGK